jgi:hypothetical protein
LGFTIFEASVSDHAVTGNDVGTGSLLAALADAGFLIWSKKEQVCNTCSSNLKLFVNVLFSDRGSEIFNAFPLSFPAEGG